MGSRRRVASRLTLKNFPNIRIGLANSRCCRPNFEFILGGIVVSELNKNRVIMGAVAVGLLALSLPLTWLTINNAQIKIEGTPFGPGGPFGNGGPSLQMPTIPGMQLAVTGTNGSLSVGISVPIWLLVIVVISATVIAVLNELQIVSVPAAVLLIPLGVVGIYFGAGLVLSLSGEATPAIGLFLAVAGLAISGVLTATQIGAQRAAVQQATEVGVAE